MDKPHALIKVYKDCQDRFTKFRRKNILVLVDLDDPHVAHRSSTLKQCLPNEEQVGDSEDWDPYNLED